MENLGRRDFLKSFGIFGLFLAGGCVKKDEQTEPKYFMTSLDFANYRFSYYATVYNLPEVSVSTTYGWIGLGRGPIYKNSGDGIVKGMERVYFAFNSFRPVCNVVGPIEITRKFTVLPLEERYVLKDKPYLLQPSGKLTVFKLEDNLSLAPESYLTYEQPVLKDELVQAWNLWKVDGDSMVASPQKELSVILSSMKGWPVAYLYEQYPIIAESA